MGTIPVNKFPIKYAIQYLRVSTAIQSSEEKTGVARQDENFKSWLKDHPVTQSGMRDLQILERVLLRATRLEEL